MAIIYSESPVPGSKAFYKKLIALSGVLVGVGFFVSEYVFVCAILLLIASVTLHSMISYSAISLNTSSLVVGKEKYNIHDIDQSFGIQNAENVLSKQEIDRLELGMSSTRERSNIRIAGGAYGRPKTGAQWLAFRQNGSQEIFVVATRDREALTESITNLMAHTLETT
jgi:hypothetical protein